jgi:hypothetical protein
VWTLQVSHTFPREQRPPAGLPEPLAPSVCLDAFWFLTPALKFYP